jgi:GNAT superfamily N-acetyltransferase
MIEPIVRRAGPSDAGALILLEREARQALVDARGGGRWLEEHPEIGSRWDDAIASRTVFAAELAFPDEPDEPAHVVGFLVLDVDGPIAHVDQVYVTSDARELGFGDALLEAATDAARATGATVLEGHALPGDRETKNLYERAGITARLITVSRRL